jgi:hypothetical protein
MVNAGALVPIIAQGMKNQRKKRKNVNKKHRRKK